MKPSWEVEAWLTLFALSSGPLPRDLRGRVDRLLRAAPEPVRSEGMAHVRERMGL